MFDIYLANRHDTCRFMLGVEGRQTLIIVGLNPSTANRDKSDPTITKAGRAARAAGFDGYVVTNLYPLRCTHPKDLPTKANRAVWRRNLEVVVKLAAQNSPPLLWAAWGADICSRYFLTEACRKLISDVAALDGRWLCFGPQPDPSFASDVTKGAAGAHQGALTKEGHPRHPSRLSYSWQFSEFNAQGYATHLV
jgi:hypothetical protein